MNTPGAVAILIGTVGALGLGNVIAQSSLSIGAVRGRSGAIVSVPLSLYSNTNIVALQADVVFDSAQVTSTLPALPQALSNHVILSSQPAAGLRRILIYSLANSPLPNDVIANIPFLVSSPSDIGAARIGVTNTMLATALPQPVSAVNWPGGIVLLPVRVHADGSVQLYLNAVPGQAYAIQTSASLTTWTNLSTTVANGALVEFNDNQAQLNSQRFYRLAPP
jgi:hypothetical protein